MCACVCVLSGKWHMSGHMFQAPGGPALCSSCSLHLSQILYPSPRSVSLLVVSLPRFLSLSLAPRGLKRGCLIQSDISLISLSTARLRFLIITPLMFSHVLMHRGADGVRACAAYCTCNHSCVFVSMCGRALSNAGTPSRCSPGSHGSTRCPPCSRLLPSRQPSAHRRSSAGRCCRGRCQNSLRYGSS